MGTVQTNIGFKDISISGEFLIPSKAVERGFSCHISVAELELHITTKLVNDKIIYALGIPEDSGLFGGSYFERDDYLTQDLSIGFSYQAGGYHLQRLYELDGNPRMKPVEDNPSPNPTHSIEMYAQDDWIVDDDPGPLSLSFGSVQWSGMNGWNPTPPGSALLDPEFFIRILPSSNVIVSFDSNWDRSASYTGCFFWMNNNLTPFNFDGVNKTTSVSAGDGSGVIHLIGSGSELIWWNDSDTGGNYGVGLTIPPPLMVDWSEYGLCKIGELKHNQAYDDVLVHGGFRKTLEMDNHFTWPLRSETELEDPLGESDEFDYGDIIPVRLGELRALGVYVQPPHEPTDMMFWNGRSISLYVDRVSHLEHNLYPKSKIDDHPLRFPIGIPHLLNPHPSIDPHYNIPVIRSDISIDIPEGLAKRPTAWESNDINVVNGGAGGLGLVEFDVPGGGGHLYRNLKSNWLERCQAFKDYGAQTGNWAPFPIAYLIHRANYIKKTFDDWDWYDLEAKTGYLEEDEDVYYFSSHRYLKIKVYGPAAAHKSIVTLELTYQTESISDSHILDLTGDSGIREVDFSLSSPKTLSYEGIYDNDEKEIIFDLASPLHAIPYLCNVTKLSLTFDEKHEGVWSLENAFLIHDACDPRAMVTTHEARHDYVSGGVRGVVNGLYPYALVGSGNYKVYAGHEKVVELINWYWTETQQLTQDGSTAWKLEEFINILNGVCEGWDWSLPKQWDEMVIDAKDNQLGHGHSFDLAERQNEIVASADDSGRDHHSILTHGLGDAPGYLLTQGYGGFDKKQVMENYPARFSAWRWLSAPQLVYRPHGVVCVQGGMHGLSDRRSSPIPMIQRKNLDMADWEDWRNDIRTDANGYFYFGDDIVYRYVDDYPLLWSYKLYYTIVDRLHERQWHILYDIEEPPYKQRYISLSHFTAQDGIIHVAHLDKRGRLIESKYPVDSDDQNIPPCFITEEGKNKYPNIWTTDDWVIHCLWANGNDFYYSRRATDEWEKPVLVISGYTYPSVAVDVQSGDILLCCMDKEYDDSGEEEDYYSYDGKEDVEIDLQEGKLYACIGEFNQGKYDFDSIRYLDKVPDNESIPIQKVSISLSHIPSHHHSHIDRNMRMMLMYGNDPDVQADYSDDMFNTVKTYDDDLPSSDTKLHTVDGVADIHDKQLNICWETQGSIIYAPSSGDNIIVSQGARRQVISFGIIPGIEVLQVVYYKANEKEYIISDETVDGLEVGVIHSYDGGNTWEEIV